MPDPKGNLLPVYILADQSYSLFDHAQDLNHGLVSLYDALRAEPMIAAKVRLSILGFSDDVEVRLAACPGWRGWPGRTSRKTTPG